MLLKIVFLTGHTQIWLLQKNAITIVFNVSVFWLYIACQILRTASMYKVLVFQS